MTDPYGRVKLGDKTSLYCSVCNEEETFEWREWSGLVFFGYVPKQEFGWECSNCGNRVFPSDR